MSRWIDHTSLGAIVGVEVVDHESHHAAVMQLGRSRHARHHEKRYKVRDGVEHAHVVYSCGGPVIQGHCLIQEVHRQGTVSEEHSCGSQSAHLGRWLLSLHAIHKEGSMAVCHQRRLVWSLGLPLLI